MLVRGVPPKTPNANIFIIIQRRISMDVIDIIVAYNPLFSPEKENIIMVPLDYVEEVKQLAKLHNAKIQIFQKRRSKYAYIRWYYPGEKDE